MKKNKFVDCSPFKLIMGYEYQEQGENYQRRISSDYYARKKWNKRFIKEPTNKTK
tara:strand:+ start:816 stop:980 length:165 start_codon:yes stop_codon:yes gene_type:complete